MSNLLDLFADALTPELAPVSPSLAYGEMASTERLSPNSLISPLDDAELRWLIRTIGELERWLAAEIEEAIVVALADHKAALACWRALAREYGLNFGGTTTE